VIVENGQQWLCDNSYGGMYKGFTYARKSDFDGRVKYKLFSGG